MASTYTDGLAVEIIGSGDKAGSWGDVTNNNLKALEEGISRYAEIGAAGSNTSTLNIPDGQTAYTDDSKGRSAVIKWTGAIASGDSHTVTLQVGGAEATQARFTAINGLSSSKDLVIDTASGTSLTIPNGYSADIHLDGSGNVVNSFSGLAVDKLALKNNEIISNETNDQIIIAADTVKVGDDGAATLSSNGDQDLILKTGNSTTGNITLVDGSNGDISITPEGSGKVVMDKVNIGGGEIDGTPIGANSANTGLFTTVGTTSDGAITANGSGNISTTSGDILTASGSMGVGVSSPGGSGNISADGLITTSGNITTTSTGTITAANGLTVTAGGIDLNGGNLDLASGGIANTGAIAGATTINASGNITGDLVGDISGNAATVTTNANLTGEVTSSGNATTIADNIVDEANLKISNAPVNDYILAADSGVTGGLKWIDQPTGDITGVTAGTNLNGGGSEGAVTVNLDSAISLANVTTSSKIIVGSDSTFTTDTPYIASQGGVRSSTYTSRTVNQAIDIYPNGTGSLTLSSTGTAGGTPRLSVKCSTAPILLQASSATGANQLIMFRTGGTATADNKFIINQYGAYLVTPASGNRYLSMCDYGGEDESGFRNDSSGNMEIRSKNVDLGDAGADAWGRAYHSGMVSGDGTYWKSTVNLGIADSGALKYNTRGSETHGLGGVPRLVQATLQCKIADMGYAIDDYIPLSSVAYAPYIWFNATHVGVSLPNNTMVATNALGEAVNQDTGALGVLLEDKWDLWVEAWK